jgi:predicted esterase
VRRAVAVALVVALAGSVLAEDEADVARALRAFFAAKDDAARSRALETLAKAPPPPRAARLLRDVLGAPPRPGPLIERVPTSGAEVECFYAGPKDTRRYTPTVLSLHASKGTGRDGLHPFAISDDEWKELRKKVDQDLVKKGFDPKKVDVKRPPPLVPWEDGLVVAPTWVESEAGVTLDRAAEICLAALARANRSFATDPDRVLLAGMSFGGAVAVQVAARHPDRFAGVVSIAGASPDAPLENLWPLEALVIHGAKDDDVPVEEGRALDRRLTDAKVKHVYREIADLGHKWPSAVDGAKTRTWMRERVRDPWPKRISHGFHASTSPRRIFWIELPPGPAATVEASVTDGEVRVTVTGASSLVLHLGPPLVDLEKEVVVRSGERELCREKVAPAWKELLLDLERVGFDASLAAPARVVVKLDGATRSP